MNLTIEKNHKLIKTTEYPNLERASKGILEELASISKGLEYEATSHKITSYNTFEELERKLDIFNCVHVATIETEFDRFEIFLNR